MYTVTYVNRARVLRSVSTPDRGTAQDLFARLVRRARARLWHTPRGGTPTLVM